MGTREDIADPPGPRSPYPRPWWFAALRFILFLALGGGLFYPVALIQAVLRHTLLTIDRTLTDPRTLLWYLPLMVAGGWALLDMTREGNVLRARRMVESRAPQLGWQRELAAARFKGDRPAEFEALITLGFWLEEEQRYEEATPYLQQALSLARALGNQPLREGRALYGLGMAAFHQGDLDTAEDLFRQRLTIARTAGPRDQLANVYRYLGEFLCAYRDKREEGCQMLAQAQAIYHVLGQAKPEWLDDEQYIRDLRRTYGDESE